MWHVLLVLGRMSSKDAECILSPCSGNARPDIGARHRHYFARS